MISDEDPQSLRRSRPSVAPVRLRESQQPTLKPSARWAVSMVRAAKPHDDDPGRRERIWASLQTAVRIHPPRIRRTRWLRLTFATSLLFVAGLFVSAAMAQWPGWLARAIEPALNHIHRSGQRAATAERPEPLPIATSSSSAPGAPNVASGQRPPQATPEESQLLLEAMRALRVERSPSRARGILATYLARHPKGALAEEALVMLTEAAAMNGDGDAPALAARYFAQYPNGEFADQVRRAVQGVAPASH